MKKILFFLLPVYLFLGCSNSLSNFEVVNNTDYDVELQSDDNVFTIPKQSTTTIEANVYSSIELLSDKLPVLMTRSCYLITLNQMQSHYLYIKNTTTEDISFIIPNNKLKTEYTIPALSESKELIYVYPSIHFINSFYYSLTRNKDDFYLTFY